ncbi:3-keto-5-aminohexanoate cleavage protein, partial [bacterium]|nr:3-keto-5-aminohexanoate cleavage protein [bacterium]
MNDFGVVPELECFDGGMINASKYLIDKGHLIGPLYYNIILGNLFNAQTTLNTLSDIKSMLPNNSVTTIGGIGSQQLKSNLYGLLEFDGVRVGLEDNLYFTDKNKATNSQLLTRIHSIMSELGLCVLASKDFKKLGYENKISDR